MLRNDSAVSPTPAALAAGGAPAGAARGTRDVSVSVASDEGRLAGPPPSRWENLKRSKRKLKKREDLPELKANAKGALTDIVQEADVLQKDLLLPKEIQEYKGTMKVHQMVWSS
ncbi:unnamed protein product [Chrysodeixis includens]|uniref:Uncharacterized protein n=1 Tax=Chrysodeixis includens TaxID=689277 RepID=A0A9N8KVJ7_CHRIL|nr:unnamed protein product [Chrysodeixis includens]